MMSMMMQMQMRMGSSGSQAGGAGDWAAPAEATVASTARCISVSSWHLYFVFPLGRCISVFTEAVIVCVIQRETFDVVVAENMADKVDDVEMKEANEEENPFEKDPNLLTVEGIREHCKLIRRSSSSSSSSSVEIKETRFMLRVLRALPATRCSAVQYSAVQCPPPGAR